MRFIITLKCTNGHESTQAIDAEDEDAAHDVAVFMAGGKKRKAPIDMRGHTCGALHGGDCTSHVSFTIAEDAAPISAEAARENEPVVTAVPSVDDVKRGIK